MSWEKREDGCTEKSGLEFDCQTWKAMERHKRRILKVSCGYGVVKEKEGEATLTVMGGHEKREFWNALAEEK